MWISRTVGMLASIVLQCARLPDSTIFLFRLQADVSSSLAGVDPPGQLSQTDLQGDGTRRTHPVAVRIRLFRSKICILYDAPHATHDSKNDQRC